MLASEIREMSEADINSRIAELERERFNLRLASGTRTLDDPLRLRVIRRDVARLRTVLREKVIGVAEVGSGSRERRSEKRIATKRTGRRGRKSARATTRAKTSKRA